MASVKITVRPPEEDAIQYTGDNEAEVQAFVGFLFEPSHDGEPPTIYDPIERYLRPLPEGSWVVLSGISIRVFSNEEFHQLYLVVDE